MKVRPCLAIYPSFAFSFAARSGDQAAETTEPGACTSAGDERSRSRKEHDQPRESRSSKKEQATAGLTGKEKASNSETCGYNDDSYLVPAKPFPPSKTYLTLILNG